MTVRGTRIGGAVAGRGDAIGAAAVAGAVGAVLGTVAAALARTPGTDAVAAFGPVAVGGGGPTAMVGAATVGAATAGAPAGAPEGTAGIDGPPGQPGGTGHGPGGGHPLLPEGPHAPMTTAATTTRASRRPTT